jgi:hypothetical protein
MLALSMSLSTRETKERSIFRMSTGRCFSRDVAHVPAGSRVAAADVDRHPSLSD